MVTTVDTIVDPLTFFFSLSAAVGVMHMFQFVKIN